MVLLQSYTLFVYSYITFLELCIFDCDGVFFLRADLFRSSGISSCDFNLHAYISKDSTRLGSNLCSHGSVYWIYCYSNACFYPHDCNSCCCSVLHGRIFHFPQSQFRVVYIHLPCGNRRCCCWLRFVNLFVLAFSVFTLVELTTFTKFLYIQLVFSCHYSFVQLPLFEPLIFVIFSSIARLIPCARAVMKHFD